MKLSSAHLEAFSALAQERNFTKAAKRIGLSQPAFSHRIKLLEAFIENTLFIREKNNISMTEIGKKLLAYVRTQQNIENEFLGNILANNMDNALRGQLRIGAFSSVTRSIVLPSLKNTLTQNNELSIQIITKELRHLPELIYSSRVDFILYNKEIIKEGFECIYLGKEKNYLYEPLSGINKDIFLDHDESDTVTSSYFRILKKKPPTKKRYLDDVYGLVDGIKLELGSAIIPKHLADKEQMKIKNRSVSLDVPVYLIYRSAPYYTKLHQVIVKEIKQGFRQIL